MFPGSPSLGGRSSRPSEGGRRIAESWKQNKQMTHEWLDGILTVWPSNRTVSPKAIVNVIFVTKTGLNQRFLSSSWTCSTLKIPTQHLSQTVSPKDQTSRKTWEMRGSEVVGSYMEVIVGCLRSLADISQSSAGPVPVLTLCARTGCWLQRRWLVGTCPSYLVTYNTPDECITVPSWLQCINHTRK